VGFRKNPDLLPGQELAGEIESAGKAVTRFKPGDLVFGTTGFNIWYESKL
jgi:NADPH:quinone reductase-like Zn-dependent oxidoreductase